MDGQIMNYAELALDLSRLCSKAVKKIQKHPLDIWVKESQYLVKTIYENTPYNSNFGSPYNYHYLLVIKVQLKKGGLRFPATLNKLFK